MAFMHRRSSTPGRGVGDLGSRRPNNSARDGDTSGRLADKEIKSMPAESNVPDRAEALEAADHGHGQELAMWNEVYGLGETIVLQPLDRELARLVAADLGPMRERLIQDMRMLDANLDQEGAAELHRRATAMVAEIDEMAKLLAPEGQS